MSIKAKRFLYCLKRNCELQIGGYFVTPESEMQFCMDALIIGSECDCVNPALKMPQAAILTTYEILLLLW